MCVYPVGMYKKDRPEEKYQDVQKLANINFIKKKVSCFEELCKYLKLIFTSIYG